MTSSFDPNTERRARAREGIAKSIHDTPSELRGRILYVITDLLVGGVPLHLMRLSAQMRARGFEPRVVSLRDIGPVGAEIQKSGVGVEGCDGRGSWDYRVVSRLARIMGEYQPDIVHSFLFHANIASRWAAKRIGFPRERVICEIQTVEVERSWHLWMDRFTHRRCRFTIGNSPAVIQHLAARARIPHDRLRLVRGGADVERIRATAPATRESLNLDASIPIVFWAGRLDPVKGLSFLLESFRLVVSQTPAYLLLAGTGPLRDELSAQIERSNLQQSVRLLGSRDDVPSLLKIADVFVLPSRTEGLPNALLEAMAAGCPIITTNVPGCRDLIQDQETGLLVPYGDTLCLAHALSELLTNRGLARRLGERAAMVAAKDWRIEQTYDAYAKIYDEVLRG